MLYLLTPYAGSLRVSSRRAGGRDLQERKRDLLARVVDDGEAFGTALTADDLRALLS